MKRIEISRYTRNKATDGDRNDQGQKNEEHFHNKGSNTVKKKIAKLVN